jgi:hypothetical protein
MAYEFETMKIVARFIPHYTGTIKMSIEKKCDPGEGTGFFKILVPKDALSVNSPAMYLPIGSTTGSAPSSYFHIIDVGITGAVYAVAERSPIIVRAGLPVTFGINASSSGQTVYVKNLKIMYDEINTDYTEG